MWIKVAEPFSLTFIKPLEELLGNTGDKYSNKVHLKKQNKNGLKTQINRENYTQICYSSTKSSYNQITIIIEIINVDKKE